MNILIFNWRDIKNPQGGGAEILTHEIAKRLVADKNRVVLFSSFFQGAKHQEVIDGVEIIRRGSANLLSFHVSVYLAAVMWYVRTADKFDVVIDEIHGIPFFTPLFVRQKKLALLCEVADNIWDVVFAFPLNIIGKVVERMYFIFYKHIPFLTISESTKLDIISKGIPAENIVVLPMGLSVPKIVLNVPKEKHHTILFVGRLTKAKGVEDALRMFALLSNTTPKIKLWIVGTGDSSYVDYLKILAKELQIDTSVKFFGFVDQEFKFELMMRAHILVNPSVREGWGLTVPEAGYVGTPSVVYNVAGLKDLVKDGVNGVLSLPNPENLAQKVNNVLFDNAMYKRLQKGAKKESLKFNWDNTARVFLEQCKAKNNKFSL